MIKANITYQLSRIRPGYRAHRDCKTAHEKIGRDDDSPCRRLVALDDPDGSTACLVCPVAETCLDAADEEHPEAHEKRADEEHGTTAPLVDVDDGGDGHDHVKDILYGLFEGVSNAGIRRKVICLRRQLDCFGVQ